MPQYPDIAKGGIPGAPAGSLAAPPGPPNPLMGLLTNPQLLASLSQILAAQFGGKQGGYLSQGIGQQFNLQQDLLRQQQEAEERRRQREIQNQQEAARIKISSAAQQSAARSAEELVKEREQRTADRRREAAMNRVEGTLRTNPNAIVSDLDPNIAALVSPEDFETARAKILMEEVQRQKAEQDLKNAQEAARLKNKSEMQAGMERIFSVDPNLVLEPDLEKQARSYFTPHEIIAFRQGAREKKAAEAAKMEREKASTASSLASARAAEALAAGRQFDLKQAKAGGVSKKPTAVDIAQGEKALTNKLLQHPVVGGDPLAAKAMLLEIVKDPLTEEDKVYANNFQQIFSRLSALEKEAEAALPEELISRVKAARAGAAKVTPSPVPQALSAGAAVAPGEYDVDSKGNFIPRKKK